MASAQMGWKYTKQTSVFSRQSRHKQRVLTSTNRVKYGRTFVQYTFSGPAGLIPLICNMLATGLKAYCGWAPKVAQSGSSLDYVALHRGGAHLIKTTVYFAVLQSLRHETEWKRLYDRLVPKKCVFDERTRQYKGKLKVVGRIAGQMLALIYGLLKADQEVLRQTPPGRQAPDPVMYDVKRHQADRSGHYRTTRPQQLRGELVQLP